MAKAKYPIPFWRGNLLSYARYQPYADADPDQTEWRENKPFEATLTYTSFERGQSAARLIFTDEHGNTYPMFLQQFDEIMLAGGFDGKKIHGMWVGVKRGENYGIQLFCYLEKN